MRLTRVHVDAPLAAGATVALPEAATGHLLRVLRMEVGDACVLFNGDGFDYPARIVSAGKRHAEVALGQPQAPDNESPLRVVLLQAVARGEKMDWIVQKATELGVEGIVPVLSDRTEVKLDAERADKRVVHWRGIATSACEQSGRARVPAIAPPLPLAKALASLAPEAFRLMLDPDAHADALGALALPGDGRVCVAIGPEGGWSSRDLAQLEEAGFRGLRLGPRVLRTETAGIAALAALQARYGDMQ